MEKEAVENGCRITELSRYHKHYLLARCEWPVELPANEAFLQTVPADNNCFFHCIGAHLKRIGDYLGVDLKFNDTQEIRTACADYLNKEYDNHFFETKGYGDKKSYVTGLRGALWAGDLEIIAIQNGCLDDLLAKRSISFESEKISFAVDVYYVSRSNQGSGPKISRRCNPEEDKLNRTTRTKRFPMQLLYTLASGGLGVGSDENHYEILYRSGPPVANADSAITMTGPDDECISMDMAIHESYVHELEKVSQLYDDESRAIEQTIQASIKSLKKRFIECGNSHVAKGMLMKGLIEDVNARDEYNKGRTALMWWAENSSYLDFVWLLELDESDFWEVDGYVTIEDKRVIGINLESNMSLCDEDDLDALCYAIRSTKDRADRRKKIMLLQQYGVRCDTKHVEVARHYLRPGVEREEIIELLSSPDLKHYSDASSDLIRQMRQRNKFVRRCIVYGDINVAYMDEYGRKSMVPDIVNRLATFTGLSRSSATGTEHESTVLMSALMGLARCKNLDNKGALVDGDLGEFDRSYLAMECLLAFGKADPNVLDHNGSTAIYHAIEEKNLLKVNILLEYGASLIIKNKNRESPIEFARRKLKTDAALTAICNRLANSNLPSPADIQKKKDAYCLRLESISNFIMNKTMRWEEIMNVDTFKPIVNNSDSSNPNPKIPNPNPNPNSYEQVWGRNGSADARDPNFGYVKASATSLNFKCRSVTALMTQAREDRFIYGTNIMEWLITYRTENSAAAADIRDYVNLCDGKHLTALHRAVDISEPMNEARLEIQLKKVCLLLDYGANRNLRGDYTENGVTIQRTPLEYLRAKHRSFLHGGRSSSLNCLNRIEKLLLNKPVPTDADIESKANQFSSNFNYQRMLQEAGKQSADATAADASEERKILEEVDKILRNLPHVYDMKHCMKTITRKTHPNWYDRFDLVDLLNQGGVGGGTTALASAEVEAGYISNIVRIAGTNGVTALMIHARDGNKNTLEWLLAQYANAAEVRKYINGSDICGSTALHYAVDLESMQLNDDDLVKRQRDKIELLVSLGADPECRNNDGYTPLDMIMKARDILKKTYFDELRRVIDNPNGYGIGQIGLELRFIDKSVTTVEHDKRHNAHFKVLHYTLFHKGLKVSFKDAIALFKNKNSELVDCIKDAILNFKGGEVFFECAPVNFEFFDRVPFEFSLISAPELKNVQQADQEKFERKHVDGGKVEFRQGFYIRPPKTFPDLDVIDFLSDENDAWLVVPTNISGTFGDSRYTHLSNFIRQSYDASSQRYEDQVENLFSAMGKVFEDKLEELARSGYPKQSLWISTSGSKVSWLNIRIDDRATYYHYMPFKQGVLNYMLSAGDIHRSLIAYQQWFERLIAGAERDWGLVEFEDEDDDDYYDDENEDDDERAGGAGSVHNFEIPDSIIDSRLGRLVDRERTIHSYVTQAKHSNVALWDDDKFKFISCYLPGCPTEARFIKYKFLYDDKKLTFGDAVQLLKKRNKGMLSLLKKCITDFGGALFFECPPVSYDSRNIVPFEFVLISAPVLENFDPVNKRSFADKFAMAANNKTGITSFWNPTKSGYLIAPTPPKINSQFQNDLQQQYAHLYSFVSSADSRLVDNLLQEMGRCFSQALYEYRNVNPESPYLWLSTDGTGVRWLHLRIDKVPKYYKYESYITQFNPVEDPYTFYNHNREMKAYSSLNVDIKDVNMYGMSALMYQAEKKNVDSRKEMVLLLKDKLVDVNNKDALGNTALWYAIRTDDYAKVELLLSYGADRFVTNLDEETPLDFAINLTKRNPNFDFPNNARVIKLLLNYGKTVCIRCVEEQKLWHYANKTAPPLQLGLLPPPCDSCLPGKEMCVKHHQRCELKDELSRTYVCINAKSDTGKFLDKCDIHQYCDWYPDCKQFREANHSYCRKHWVCFDCQHHLDEVGECKNCKYKKGLHSCKRCRKLCGQDEFCTDCLTFKCDLCDEDYTKSDKRCDKHHKCVNRYCQGFAAKGFDSCGTCGYSKCNSKMYPDCKKPAVINSMCNDCNILSCKRMKGGNTKCLNLRTNLASNLCDECATKCDYLMGGCQDPISLKYNPNSRRCDKHQKCNFKGCQKPKSNPLDQTCGMHKCRVRTCIHLQTTLMSDRDKDFCVDHQKCCYDVNGANICGKSRRKGQRYCEEHEKIVHGDQFETLDKIREPGWLHSYINNSSNYYYYYYFGIVIAAIVGVLYMTSRKDDGDSLNIFVD